MSINVTRDEEQYLNFDPRKENISPGIRINREPSTTKPAEDSMHFIMNEDAQGQNNNVEEFNQNESYNASTGEVDEVDVGEDYNEDVNYGENYIDTTGQSFEDIEKEKATYLSKLYRLSNNPNLSCRKLTYAHSLEEIKSEVFRCEKDLEIMNGVQLYRTGLIFLSQGMEFGLDKGMKWHTMNGWSRLVTKDVSNSEYDKVLEEIYEIWGGSAVMRPEFRLIMMLGTSAFNFHLQKLMAEQAMNNPAMMASFAEKMANASKMKGPSEDTDEILRRLEESDDSSIASDPPPQPKKRGRKKKTT